MRNVAGEKGEQEGSENNKELETFCKGLGGEFLGDGTISSRLIIQPSLN